MKVAVIDTETPGLNPFHHRDTGILEVAVVICDESLDEVETYESLVVPPYCKQLVIEDRWWREVCEPAAYDMHVKNGLIERVKVDGRPHETVERELAELFARHNDGDRKNLYLMGNSLASLDLPFLKAKMGSVLEHVHYRILDVSGFRVGCQLAFKKDYAYPKARGHRAMADVRECIAEMKFIANGLYRHIYMEGYNAAHDGVDLNPVPVPFPSAAPSAEEPSQP